MAEPNLDEQEFEEQDDPKTNRCYQFSYVSIQK